MAFSFGFYDSDNHDRRYSAAQLSMIFDGIISDGVYATVGKSFIVEATSDPGIILVPTGRAWFDHTWNYNDSDLKITAPLSDLTLERIDALVIDIQSNDKIRTNDIIWVKGEPSLEPKRPIMIHENEHNQYPLCYISRKANVELINQEDITNTVGTSECPFVTGILEVVSIDDLLIQWKDQWTQFFTQYQNNINEWTTEQETNFENMISEFEIQMKNFEKAYGKQFNDWFATVQDTLDGDTAGKLLNLINALDEKEEKHHYGLLNSSTDIEDKTITTTTSEETTTTNIVTESDGTKKITATIIPNEGNFYYVKTTTIFNTVTGKNIQIDVATKPKSDLQTP